MTVAPRHLDRVILQISEQKIETKVNSFVNDLYSNIIPLKTYSIDNKMYHLQHDVYARQEKFKRESKQKLAQSLLGVIGDIKNQLDPPKSSRGIEFGYSRGVIENLIENKISGINF